MEGAQTVQAGKALRERGELEAQIDHLSIGNQQLNVIQKRLAVIRDNLYGKRAEIEKMNKVVSGTLIDPVQNGAAAKLRQEIERSGVTRESISELLNEIESFI